MNFDFSDFLEFLDFLGAEGLTANIVFLDDDEDEGEE